MTRTLGCSPWLPPIFNVPVKQRLDFRVVREQVARDFYLAVTGYSLQFQFRTFFGAFWKCDPRLELLVDVWRDNFLYAGQTQPDIFAVSLQVEVEFG